MWFGLLLMRKNAFVTRKIMQDFSLILCLSQRIRNSYDAIENKFQTLYPNGVRKADIHYTLDTTEKLAIINYTSGTFFGFQRGKYSINSNLLFAVSIIPYLGEKRKLSQCCQWLTYIFDTFAFTKGCYECFCKC